MTGPDPRLRIGDADRERAMADLAQHYTEGRLDHEEYDERLDAVWTARTRADLALLFEDLPRTPAPAPRATRAPARPAPGRRSRPPLLPILALLIGLSIVFEAPVWLLVIPIWFVVRHRRRGPHRAHGRANGWAQHPTDYRRRPSGYAGW